MSCKSASGEARLSLKRETSGATSEGCSTATEVTQCRVNMEQG